MVAERMAHRPLQVAELIAIMSFGAVLLCDVACHQSTCTYGASAAYAAQNYPLIPRTHGVSTRQEIPLQTSEAESIGTAISSGCFRMTNRDVMELFKMVAVGAKVIVE